MKRALRVRCAVRARRGSRATVALVGALSLVLAGCGGSHQAANHREPKSPTTTMSTSAQVPKPIPEPHLRATPAMKTTQVTTRPASPPLPSRALPPNRLVAGPLLLRLTGAPTPDERPSNDETPQPRYAVIFRLNRASFAENTSGVYTLVVTARHPPLIEWDPDNAVLPFGAAAHHCFIGYVSAPQTRSTAALDALPISRPVSMALRPFTPNRQGVVTLGPTYLARPRIQLMDWALTSKIARDTLRGVGCPTATNIEQTG